MQWYGAKDAATAAALADLQPGHKCTIENENENGSVVIRKLDDGTITVEGVGRKLSWDEGMYYLVALV